MQPPVRLKQPSPEEFRDRFLHYLRYSCGIEMQFARAADHLEALALAVRESIIDRTILTRATYDEVRPKVVNYLSLEYLLGRLMRNGAASFRRDADVLEAMDAVLEARHALRASAACRVAPTRALVRAATQRLHARFGASGSGSALARVAAAARLARVEVEILLALED